MKKAGRKLWTPSKEILSEIEILSLRGLTLKQIADNYEISYPTLNNARKRHKKLDIVLKKGKAKGIAFVTGKLFEKIREGNIAAIFFYLKTQAGGHEKNTVEVKDKVKYKKPDYKLDTMDAIEASKIYQSIMTGSYKDE